jgi:o-succinylbenzoate synthase
LAGSLDTKYSEIGRRLKKARLARYEEVEGAGHALLVEMPSKVAELAATFLECSSSDISCDSMIVEEQTKLELHSMEPVSKELSEDTQPAEPLPASVRPETIERTRGQITEASLGSLEFESFSINVVDSDRGEKRVFGVGWGNNAEASVSSVISSRSGFIVQVDCADGFEVGIGEVSPLAGLHSETMEEAEDQLIKLQRFIEQSGQEDLPAFDAESILELDGAMQEFLRELSGQVGIGGFLPSVRSGLEMALLSLASQKVSLPLHQALAGSSARKSTGPSSLSVNGLITRGASSQRFSSSPDQRSFPSLKIKVGHQSLSDDAVAMLRGFHRTDLSHRGSGGRIRADANRAWNERQAIEFASALEGLDVHALDRVEFIEEPLAKVPDSAGNWSFARQIEALERTFMHTGIPYALDETIADLAEENSWNFDSVQEKLESVFKGGTRGCAALVLKPALLGLELSMQIARFARTKLGIGVVLSSSFDSGVGLAHTSFLASLSDQITSTARTYPHGVGTFTMLGADTLVPPFESYVNENGLLNIPSLSRALYGLSLDELRESLTVVTPPLVPETALVDSRSKIDEYEASTATSDSGREISVVVTLPLPFSAETASSRFTDLPSMSRWSPWISSVQYLGTETEWTVDVRGIPLKWRATSQILDDPYPGIQWQSVSGVSNRGIVEFAPESSSSCTMNVRMTIVTPRLLRPLFQGTSLFVEEFLRDKLLKWSLEMFRDVVKADLALERYVQLCSSTNLCSRMIMFSRSLSGHLLICTEEMWSLVMR